jgi:hypothetical protein
MVRRNISTIVDLSDVKGPRQLHVTENLNPGDVIDPRVRRAALQVSLQRFK